MKFAAYKNDNGWGLIPQDGPFAGQTVVEVEAFSMEKVAVEAKTLVGTLKSIWGATVLIDEAFEDIETLRSLRINRNFDLWAGSPVWFDYDGVWSAKGKVLALRAASAFGDKIFGR